MSTFEFNGHLFVREKVVCVTAPLVYEASNQRFYYKFDVYMDWNAISIVGDSPYQTEADVQIARTEFVKLLIQE